jgi:hypothetical protein
MPAPTKYPDWATDESNNVEPPDAKKAAGWVPGEEPPSSWFNWWKNLAGQWVRWLEERANTLTTDLDAAEADIDTLQSDLDTLEAATAALASDAARKSQQNTFVKSQIINTESNWADDPLLTTTAKPGDDPTDLSGVPAAPGSNRWKLVLACPTQGGAWAGIFVGQSPYGAALVNNARWHIPTQKWRQLDDGYASTGIIGRSGQWVASYKPAGASPWTDWPTDNGGDFIAGGNLACNGNFLYHPGHARGDFTIPLSCATGETLLQSDGSYKLGSSGKAAWPLKLPDLTVLTDIYLIVEHGSAAGSLATLVRRDKGSLVLPTAMPAHEELFTTSGPAASGVQLITLPCNGHVYQASQEYAVWWQRAHADDKIGRISLGTFNEAMLFHMG